MFSKACEYGIRASIFIAKNSIENRRVNQKEISQKIDSPQAFTAKILQALVKHNIIDSKKGIQGGFEINQNKIRKIKLSDIVDAIDGDAIYKSCGLGLKRCNADHPCPLHDKFEAIRDDLKGMLESTNLEELALGIRSKRSFLKI